ncbi:MAG TPA: permease-like cell division protein FtsX [Candidatus Krumholzibacteria bacterium]|nr:permease-like cell division protein FtsX [Candidatus Krumholzibacteria bacterium]
MYGTTQMKHFVREALLGLARRRVSGTVAVLIMGSALLMLALFSLITINLDRVLQSVRGDIDAEVFLQPSVSPEQQQTLQHEILAVYGVKSVYYVSKAKALEEFRADLGNDASLLDGFSENPLPASFRLQFDDEVAHDAAKMDDLVRVLKQFPWVEDVVSQVETVHRLDRLARIFKVVDLIVGLLVLVSAIFVISNTVRLTVEERARSIDIMKQVGATNWFIRTPFLLGGALQGAAAGALAMILLLIAHRFLQREISGVYFFASGQIIGFVILSTLLGVVGSGAALRRHLRL